MSNNWLDDPFMTMGGGPAFPFSIPETEQRGEAYFKGMTLRDWFAGQCLERMISLSMDGDGAWEFDNVAHGAYQLADAMLRAREIPKP